MDWATHKKILLKDPEFKKALRESELEYKIARALIRARLKKGISQAQLADRLKTKQSVISRLENARSVPTISFLRRIAHALGGTVDVNLRV